MKLTVVRAAVLWRRAGQIEILVCSAHVLRNGDETFSISVWAFRAVYAQQEALLKIDVIRLDSRFDKLVPST